MIIKSIEIHGKYEIAYLGNKIAVIEKSLVLKTFEFLHEAREYVKNLIWH